MKTMSLDHHLEDHHHNSISLPLSNSQKNEIEELNQQQMLRDILMDDSVIRFYEPDTNQHYSIIHEERNWLHTLVRIDSVMRALIKTNEPLISRTRIQGTTIDRVCKTALARKLEFLLWTFTADHVHWCFPMFQFNPWVSLYMHLSRKCDLGRFSGIWRGDRVAEGDYGDAWVNAINSFAIEARTEGRKPDFRNTAQNFKRNEHSNFEGLRTLVSRLFEHYSRLMVVRVDLGFKKYCPALTGNRNTKASDVVAAKAVFKQFLRNMRSKTDIYEHVVGYAWKAEIGTLRGVHFHVVLFFDGSKVRQDASYGEMVGKRWRDVITEGDGHYYNCNRRKNSYKECGVGMVCHSDTEKRDVLNNRVLPYLTKSTSLLKADFGKRCRTFGRSELPKRNQKKLGRQRRRSLVH